MRSYFLGIVLMLTILFTGSTGQCQSIFLWQNDNALRVQDPVSNASLTTTILLSRTMDQLMMDYSRVSRANFIGRRRIIREHLKSFLDGRNRCLMFTGPGGVGKSTTAGFFVRRFADKHADA